MSPTGPNYATTVVDTGTGGGGAWTNPGNAAGAPDAVYASGNISTGGAVTNELRATDFGFSIPSTAIIDGIKVEFDRYGTAAETSDIQLVKSGSAIGTIKTGTDIWPGTEAFVSYGGSSDLWGTTLTYADVNDSTFGVQLAALNTHGGGTAFVDAIRITVYWHTAPTEIPRQKYYIGKVYDSLTNNYLGNLPNMTPLQFSQDINTGGTHIAIECHVSADTAADAVQVYTDESGATYTTEDGSEDYVSSGVEPFTGIGTGSALIRDGNKVQIWEYGYYHPNGICMFRGVIERHSDNFGGDTGNNNIELLIYSDGADLNNHFIVGQTLESLDQSQTQTGDDNGFWNTRRYGQTFTTGIATRNISKITLQLLRGSAGNRTITVRVWPNTASATIGGTPLGSATVVVSSTSFVDTDFVFSSPIPVNPSTSYFFSVEVDSGSISGDSTTWAGIENKASNPYSGGDSYKSDSGGAWSNESPNDLYFKTYHSYPSTTHLYSNQDPSTGMLSDVMNTYISENGLIGIGDIQATGLSLSYSFNTNTTYEGLQAALSLSPKDFYYYVDLGTDLLYFKEANTQADFVLTKGVHINKLSVVSTIEYVVNTVFVVGADTGGGNVYTSDNDPTSVALYGQRLQIHADNNIPDTTTAHAVGKSIVEANKDEQYQTSVTILDKTMDITLLVPGKIIGFNGFGSYVDGLLAQIVHRDYAPDSVTLTLGILPKRDAVTVGQVVRGVTALNTVNNPSAPS